MGALRLKVGHSDFGKANGLFEDKWAPLWVVDFPMFERDDEEGRWNAVHHPFTAPKDGHEDLMDTDPGACIAKAYDMVLNGWELGGGSVRIHRADVQSKVFSALNISQEDAQIEVRLPAGRAAVRRPAARRPGLRPRPHRHDDDRRRVDPRRDRLPEDATRAGPADGRAERRSTRSSCASCTSACAARRSRRRRPERPQT